MPNEHGKRTLTPSGSKLERSDLIHSLFALALASEATERFWIDSPWITNAVVLSNGYGQFRGVFPDEGQREVRLVDYLAALQDKGTDVRVITREPSGNAELYDFRDQFMNRLGEQCIQIDPLIHAKGIITDLYLVSGSMNLTYSGIRINGERLDITAEPSEIARSAHDFGVRWDELGSIDR